MSEHPEGIEIQDPEDYSSSTRLQQIFEARRQLREIRREASKFRHSSQKIQAIEYYRSGVESYLLEVDTLLRQHDPGPKLWAKKHYGTVTVRPPGNFQKIRGTYVAQDIEVEGNVPLKASSLPEPKEVDIIGLKWLFETDTPVTRTFEFSLANELHSTYTDTNSGFIAWTTLNRMVSDVNSFLGELGIGLDVDDTEEWKI